MANGKEWQILRRFAIQALRDFGVGKKSLEERIHNETAALISELEKSNGRPQNPNHVTQKAVINIICSIIFGER